MDAVKTFAGQVWRGEETGYKVVDIPRRNVVTTIALTVLAGLALYNRAQLQTLATQGRQVFRQRTGL